MNTSRQCVRIVCFWTGLFYAPQLCAQEAASAEDVRPNASVVEHTATGVDGQGGSSQTSGEQNATEDSQPGQTAVETGESEKQEFARARLANAVMGKPEEHGAKATTKEKMEPLNPRQIAVWSLVSIAGATLITGGIFGLAAGADKAQYDNNSDEELKEQATAKAIVSAVSFGIAGAAAITAFILWITDRDAFEPSRHKTASKNAAFSIGVDGTSVSIHF
jgi:hypothetical protein